MLTCKEITQLISESLDGKLPLWSRVKIRLHFMVCSMCAGFRKDLLHIRDESQRYSDEADDSGLDVRLSDEARNRMRKTLESRE